MARFCPLKTFWNASFLYPFKGIIYFARHPAFWPLFSARLIPIVLLSTFIFANLFVWTYLPQVLFLSIFHGAGAWINATSLVLGEGAALTAILFEAFFVDETLVDVFDAVLIQEGLSELVAKKRMINADGENAIKMLGKPSVSAVYSPFSLRQIVEFVVLLPLNLIPVAGVPLFLLLTGYRAGPFHHWRYFQLLDLNKNERKSYIQRRKLRYTWFGAVALLLQFVPVLSMFFLLTSAAGSALWAAQMEETRQDYVSHGSDTMDTYEDDPV